MKRAVVTGMGAVSPLGNSFADSWLYLQKGISGIDPITGFDASGMKWKVAGELKKFNPKLYLSDKEIAHLDPFVHYAVAASVMAVKDAGLIKDHNALTVMRNAVGKKSLNSSLITCHSSLYSAGVIIGSSRGGITTIERELGKIYASGVTRHASRLSPYLMPSTSVNAAASYAAQVFGAKGHCIGISNACTSGANAIGEAYRLIRSGYSGPILAGGAEAPICRLCIEGYGASGALSKGNDSSASRPFDRTRDGFVLSEGACVLVIEEYTSAVKRGARIYGEIIGYGTSTDAFHQTRPDPEGEARAINMALEEAKLNHESIDYINAHGTSTRLGDKVETEAIRLAFGKKAYDIPISSVKSMTGHMLAASGAFEAGVTLKSIHDGILTPTVNLKNKDPECNLNYVTETRRADIKIAISNSFGFGGVNAVLVFKRV